MGVGIGSCAAGKACTWQTPVFRAVSFKTQRTISWDFLLSAVLQSAGSPVIASWIDRCAQYSLRECHFFQQAVRKNKESNRIMPRVELSSRLLAPLGKNPEVQVSEFTTISTVEKLMCVS